MAKEPTTARAHYANRTITLPITEELYAEIINDPKRFHAEWLDPWFKDCPELFPPEFEKGYEMNGHYDSIRQGITIRRIELRNAEQYQIRPGFVMPMMVARTEDVQVALFLRKFGVPYWGIVRVFGRNVAFWYRLEISLGRNSIVGTTVKTVPVPEHLLADEKHETCCGEKVYIATTVAQGVMLGAEVSPSASTQDLKESYGVFKEEAQETEPEYAPKTVNTDGWSGTIGAWAAFYAVKCFETWVRRLPACIAARENAVQTVPDRSLAGKMPAVPGRKRATKHLTA